MRKGLIAGLFVVAGLLVLVAVVDADPEPSADEPAQDQPDAGARLACSHWRNVVADLQAGILSPGEVREKARELHDDARLSDEPGIAEHSEAMLRAATADEGEAFMSAAEDFTAACSRAGAY